MAGDWPPVASPTSSPATPSTRCSCTATTLPARPAASTPTMPSFKPPGLSRTPPPPAMMPSARGRSSLSLAKLPIRPPAVGPPRPTVLTHGVTASNRNKTLQVITIDPAPNIHALQASNTMAADPSNSPAGGAIGVDLLNNPDLVATDPVISFKTALWFWMTPQSPKPSCHNIITERWTRSDEDRAAGRLPGYGTVTNIINGGPECGRGQDSRVADRIGFFMRYCDIFGVGYGDNLDCYSQTPFSPSSHIDAI